MGVKITFCSIVIFIWLSSINALGINSGESIKEGNCSGKLDYFLCNCLTSNATIDIHLSPGRYHFVHQPFCLLQNKTSITLIGHLSNDTIIECKEPFNIVFMKVQSVNISNIKMLNCGNVANDCINETFYNATNNTSHFGSGFRHAIMFYQVTYINISGFTMENTLGYGIVVINAIGNIIISKSNIVNTTFENDPQCNDHDYSNLGVDSICSGSGVFVIYFDYVELCSVKSGNTTLIIDRSKFVANRNILPYNQFSILFDVINTGFFRTSIPLQGAASITIFYLQKTYDVNTTIANTLFHNNNGTLSASIALGSLSTTRGKTFIMNCLFDDNSRINESIGMTYTRSRGGISYYYFTLKTGPSQFSANATVNLTPIEIMAVVQCNFTKNGGTFGGAIHIEKLSSDLQSLSFRIEQCNFIANEANVGSAVYAVEHRFDATLSNDLIINLINVNAKNNALLPGATVQYSSSAFITGVFHSETCQFKLNCSIGCEFSNNQPSVFYGLFAYLTISGKAIFINNTARYGGGLHLVNAVVFIHQGSDLYFNKNHATQNGGAIDVFSSTTNIQTQDVCPIQFVGSINDTPIFSLEDINQIKVNVSFEQNTARSLSKLESVYSSVFYVCAWYPNTLTQIKLGKNAPITNGTRPSVYREILQFIPANTADDHLSILAYLPCPCNKNNTYDAQYCMTADFNNTLKLGTTVIVGRSFTISLITLDVVGSIGHSSSLYSEVTSLNITHNLMLPMEQRSRKFSIANKACTPINFTIYALQSDIPSTGLLHLSLSRNTDHYLNFSLLNECPIGFNLQNVSGMFACACGGFFNTSPIKEDFQCDTLTGKITRADVQSWLSIINDRIEYIKYCLPQRCNNVAHEFDLTDQNRLCTHHHTGRACGACEDGLSKTFGSNFCEKCSNFWLFTILLYGILGITLVSIIHLLKLTVTIGTINGLIFFCNVMSINENIFFDSSKFSFTRVFVSLINLDLGFRMCFYREMTEIGKTGLQFVFPIYLWLLMFIIIMVGKRYIRSRKSTHSAVPVLATLILLSYSKILRATISVFSYATGYYSAKDANFSLHRSQFIAWQSDPNIEYFTREHIVLFFIALVFIMLFILPLAFALTFPKTVLRSKKMSYFFPLLDCIYAPYKNQYRYWLGVRLIILIYLSGMESISFSYQDSLQVSGAVIVLLFALIQAYIHPFKNKINNILDLMFMGIFITLAIVSLHLYPPDTSHLKETIAVETLGSVAFFLFCFIIFFHLNDALNSFTWYSIFTKSFKAKFNIKNNWNPLHSITSKDAIQKPDKSSVNDSLKYACLQESLLEEQFD